MTESGGDFGCCRLGKRRKYVSEQTLLLFPASLMQQKLSVPSTGILERAIR